MATTAPNEEITGTPAQRKAKLNRKKPHGKLITGPTSKDKGKFTQNGIVFDAEGNFVRTLPKASTAAKPAKKGKANSKVLQSQRSIDAAKLLNGTPGAVPVSVAKARKENLRAKIAEDLI